MVQKDGKKVDKLFLENKNAFYFGNPSSNSTFKLDHPSISKNHACIFIENDSRVFLVDLNSSNGTYLNNQKLKILQPVMLNPNDTIRFALSSRKYTIEIDRKKV